MKYSWTLLVVSVVAVATLCGPARAQAQGLQPIPSDAGQVSAPEQSYPQVGVYNPRAAWHGYYYDAAWGMPIALVVPPQCRHQTEMGWGVGNTRITPVSAQFHRDWPGTPVYDRRGFRATPPWPSDTDQFGVYYVRGPR